MYIYFHVYVSYILGPPLYSLEMHVCVENKMYDGSESIWNELVDH